nr:response regulator transcription factor [Actinopolyspora mzabensis]
MLLAEDMHMVRGALGVLLSLEPDIEVAAEVATGDEIMPQAKQHCPDVAILDISLPGKDGITVATELHSELPDCRTLILTNLGTPATIRRALANHVDGFMLKDAPADKLATSVREVAVGRRAIETELALKAWDTEECPLTQRELQILRLTSAGHDPGEIAASLYLSAGTVRNYLTAAVTKLNARNRLHAVRIATDSEWL